jgi:Integral membrane protein TerC family
MVFSFDSVITAVGMVDNLLIIIVAVLSSFTIMLFSAKYIFAFVNRHPTVKMLALAFLVLIRVFLIADGFEVNRQGAHLRSDGVRHRRGSTEPGCQAAAGKRMGKPIDSVHLRHAYTKADDREAVAAATARGP